jgi:hypothetical protein
MKCWIPVGLPALRLMPLVLLAILVSWPVAGVAQEPPSLIDIAREEQARKKAIKRPSKTYGDKDLKRATPPREASPATSDATLVPVAPAPSKTPPAAAERTAKDEDAWRSRMNQVREELRRNEMFAEALQTRINGLTGEFANRDDPFQRAKIGEDRLKAITELERVKTEIAKAKKSIADIEDEARLAGVPPGWIR